MGLKEGLLCLLAVADTHGYELKSLLEATTGDMWQVNVGQIYTTLQRLERDGMVVHGDAENGKIAYSLTAAGRSAAVEWMKHPVELAVANRDEISLKVLMAMKSGIEDPRRVIERQRGVTMALLQDYTSLRAGESGDEIAWLIYLDRLVFSAEAELRWLDKVESRLEELTTLASAPGAEVTSETMEEVRS